jgi:hypothetical protein
MLDWLFRVVPEDWAGWTASRSEWAVVFFGVIVLVGNRIVASHDALRASQQAKTIADLGVQAASANREAAQSKERVAELELKRAEDLKEYAKLVASIAPRKPEQFHTARALQPFKGTTVLLCTVDDSEAISLAAQMRGVFMGANWKFVDEGVTSELVRDGITIETGSAKSVVRAAETLISQLGKYHIKAVRMPGPGLPENTIRIKIGRLPRPYFDELVEELIIENDGDRAIMFGNEFYFGPPASTPSPRSKE